MDLNKIIDGNVLQKLIKNINKDYVKKTDDKFATVSDFRQCVLKSELDNKLGDYFLKSDLNNKLGECAKYSDLSGYIRKNEINTYIGSKPFIISYDDVTDKNKKMGNPNEEYIFTNENFKNNSIVFLDVKVGAILEEVDNLSFARFTIVRQDNGSITIRTNSPYAKDIKLPISFIVFN